MTSRRSVRVAQSFFDQLDEQLGPDRGPNGEPSSTDFLVLDLPILERFAEDFDSLAVAYQGRPDYRVLVASSTLVATAIVIGQSRDDETTVLLAIEIDLTWPEEL